MNLDYSKATGNLVVASPDSCITLEPKQRERKNDVEQKANAKAKARSKTKEAESDGNGQKGSKEHKPHEPTPKVIRQVLIPYLNGGLFERDALDEKIFNLTQYHIAVKTVISIAHDKTFINNYFFQKN